MGAEAEAGATVLVGAVWAAPWQPGRGVSASAPPADIESRTQLGYRVAEANALTAGLQ